MRKERRHEKLTGRKVNKMYEWLLVELDSIRTPKYNVVAGEAHHDFRDTVVESNLCLPDEYKEFALTFGNSRFFRQSLFGYRLGIVAAPRKHPIQNSFFQVGFCDGRPLYLKEGRSEVYEGSFREPSAPSFKVWLETAYDKIKANLPDAQWQSLVAGPRPLDDIEASVLGARQKFSWTDLGFNEENDRLLSIMNGSDRKIPCFTLGVVSDNQTLNGAIIVEAGDLAPESEETFALPCYKQFYNPKNLTLFNLSEPGPEDREFLAELKRLNSNSSNPVSNRTSQP